MSIPGVVARPADAPPKEKRCRIPGYENCLYPRQLTNHLLELLVPKNKCEWACIEDIPANINLAVRCKRQEINLNYNYFKKKH